MLSVVQFNESGGVKYLLVEDMETGQTAKDILTVPGTYAQITETYSGVTFKLERLTGAVGDYRTSLFGLVVDGNSNSLVVVDSQKLNQILTVPAVAAKTLLASYDEETQTAVKDAMDIIQFYESIKENDRLCLPHEALSELPENIAAAMTSSRKSYSIRATENQEILQTSPTAEFSIPLPTLDTIHSGNLDAVTVFDVLRVVMPYRREDQPGVFSYKSIYHTPYYRVDRALRGMVPSNLSWISGYASNNLLGFQPNERHMISNLSLLICSDLSRYVAEITTSILMESAFGSMLMRFCDKKSLPVINQLCDDLRAYATDSISCNIPSSDVDTLVSTGWYLPDVVDLIKRNLHIEPSALQNLVEHRPIDRRVIDCDNLPFTLTLTDEQEVTLTDFYINNGFITSKMREFLLDLCCKAYRVNWGYTGASQAIPVMVDRTRLDDLDVQMASFLADRTKNKVTDATTHPNLYAKDTMDDDNQDDSGIMFLNSESGGSDEIYSQFDYYISTETAVRIAEESLDHNYFSTKASVQSPEAAIVEYWRTVNGEVNLVDLISTAYLMTGDVNIFIECFIKLMRWGERKPKWLVIQDHPEVRKIMDLTNGLLLDNTALVDENDLIQVNGCDYSLAALLTSNSNYDIDKEQVIGFLLQKNYGTVQKDYLASWVDIGEMVDTGNIVVGELVALTNIGTAFPRINIESFEKRDYNFYVSDSNIAEGFKLEVAGKDLSTVALLTTPEITSSTPYLRSLKNDRIITTKDRQYDILRRYVTALKEFRNQCGASISNIQNSMELQKLAAIFYGIYQSSQGKADSNAVAAGNTMQSLNFGSTVKDPVAWDDSILEGKFYIIGDKDMKSSLPPIQFTDAQLSNFVRNSDMLHNRVVMLLLQMPDRVLLCRKDINQSELKFITKRLPDGTAKKTVGYFPYSAVMSTVEDLQRGASRKIKQIPAYLHTSLKGLL